MHLFTPLRLILLLMLVPTIGAAQPTLSNAGVLTCSLVRDESKRGL